VADLHAKVGWPARWLFLGGREAFLGSRPGRFFLAESSAKLSGSGGEKQIFPPHQACGHFLGSREAFDPGRAGLPLAQAYRMEAGPLTNTVYLRERQRCCHLRLGDSFLLH